MFGYSSWGCLFLILGLVRTAPHPTHPAVPPLTPSPTQLFLVSAPIGSFPGKFESRAPFLPRETLSSLVSKGLPHLSFFLGFKSGCPWVRFQGLLHSATSWQVRFPQPHPHPHPQPQPQHTHTLFEIHLCMGLTGSLWKIKNPIRNHSVSGTKTAAKMPPGLQLPRLPPSKEGTSRHLRGRHFEKGRKESPASGARTQSGEGERNTHLFLRGNVVARQTWPYSSSFSLLAV